MPICTLHKHVNPIGVALVRGIENIVNEFEIHEITIKLKVHSRVREKKRTQETISHTEVESEGMKRKKSTINE